MGTMQQIMNSVKDYVKSPMNRLWSKKMTFVEWKHNERVEVQAFAGSTVVELGENKTKCTPVMVRVAAPSAPEQQEPPRTPVDVVAVLNTSKSMEGMETKVKEAIMAVINKLDVNDRLSLVTLEEHTESEEMELMEMRESDRATAVQKIESITNKSWSSSTECSMTLSDKALQRVVTQMKKTTTSEERHRCVMLLSCVQDQVDMKKWITEVKTHEFQLHTFDLGGAQQQHDAGRFKCLVDQRAGTYHYLASNTSSITEAFGNFVSSLQTVVATSVRVSVSLKAEAPQQGFSILPVETGGHCGSGEHHIHIADMHAGEHKSFMVYLQQNSSHQEVTTATVNKILSVNGSYRRGCSTSSKDSPLPCSLHGKEITTKREVAAEVVRSMIVKQVKEEIDEVKTTTTTTTEMHLLDQK